MICISIVNKTFSQAMRAVADAAAVADVIELRLDLIRNSRPAELIAHAKACREAVKILITCRPATHDDLTGERERIELLQEAAGMGVDYVDVELETPSALREELIGCIEKMGRRTALIVSHHDFAQTPPLKTLKYLFDRCSQAGADIVKIVTRAARIEDNLRVLSLLECHKQKDTALISFCMGPHGRLSRVAAPLLGSFMSYASLGRGLSSAPGQLTVKEMKTVMRILRRDP